MQVIKGHGIKAHMILITRRDGTQFYINPELIQTVESTPDTVIMLTNQTIIVAKESAEEIVDRFIEYRKKVYSGLIETLKER